MDSIGVRELKEQTSAILRRVRERGESLNVTYHGKVVARLVPVEPPVDRVAESLAALDEIERIAAEIGASWPEEVSTVDAVRDVRREL